MHCNDSKSLSRQVAVLVLGMIQIIPLTQKWQPQIIETNEGRCLEELLIFCDKSNCQLNYPQVGFLRSCKKPRVMFTLLLAGYRRVRILGFSSSTEVKAIQAEFVRF